MSGYWFDLGLVALLVLVNAAFAGSEMALVSLREGQLKHLDRHPGPRARRLVRLVRDPNRFLATIQIGITLAGFLASATAAVSLAEPLVPSLSALGRAAEPVAVASVTLVLTFVTLVVGELAPKRLAMQRALPWALAVARPIDWLSTVTRPFVALLGGATNLLVRLLGGRTEVEPEDISPDELRDLVSTHRVLEADQRAIISGAIEIRERTLREVLVPRGSVVRISATMSLGQARRALVDSGHSRAPVVEGQDFDRVIGVVHWSSVATGGPGPVAGVVGPALHLPDTLPVLGALRQFQDQRQHLAIVVDEHGSADGIVTLEDVLEEIVGEIYDETDRDVRASERTADGSLLIPGTFALHDLPDIGVELDERPTGDYTTVAGLVLARLGRVPDEPGDSVVLGDRWRAEVLAVRHHAITRVQLTRLPEGE